jgi:hypothetical protein
MKKQTCFIFGLHRPWKQRNIELIGHLEAVKLHKGFWGIIVCLLVKMPRFLQNTL